MRTPRRCRTSDRRAIRAQAGRRPQLSTPSSIPNSGCSTQKPVSILAKAEAGDPYRYRELAEAMEEKNLRYLSVPGTH
ncbi:MAG: hypothetical protein WCE23_04840 [Candidatus Binatus sp.]|uniref:hypothetical protein n=1 Tax=Candidatus Binatus sp. TaxID=2811406 RepID=UPI003C744A22